MFEEKKTTYNKAPIIEESNEEKPHQEYHTSSLDFSTPHTMAEPVNDYIQVEKGTEIEEINKNTNYIFFFGTAQSGKSVITSTMLYYLNINEGALRPNKELGNDYEAKVLKSTFFDNLKKGILPERTTKGQITNLNFTFEPNNKSDKVPPINLTFLEISGEDLGQIKRGGKFPEHIDKYLRAKIPLTFIIVTSYDNAHNEDGLIGEFLDELETYGINPKTANIILVISKWDKSGLMQPKNADELDDFIDERLGMTSQRMDINQFAKTYYTVGNVSTDNISDVSKVEKLRLTSARNLSYWLYESITGIPLDYQGTFWERLKWGIFGK